MIRDSEHMNAIFKRIRRLWKAFPDLRLGQLIGNCANYQQIYYLSDEEIIQLMESKYNPLIEKREEKRKVQAKLDKEVK